MSQIVLNLSEPWGKLWTRGGHDSTYSGIPGPALGKCERWREMGLISTILSHLSFSPISYTHMCACTHMCTHTYTHKTYWDAPPMSNLLSFFFHISTRYRVPPSYPTISHPPPTRVCNSFLNSTHSSRVHIILFLKINFFLKTLEKYIVFLLTNIGVLP